MTPPFCRRWRAPVESFTSVFTCVLSVESSSTIRVCGVLAYTRTAFNVCGESRTRCTAVLGLFFAEAR